MATRQVLSIGGLWFACLLAACGSESVDVCENVDCSLHGDCREANGQAVCDCHPGYLALGLLCHPDWCAQLPCDHGACIQNAERGACECEAGWSGSLCDACAEGYHLDNGACLPDLPCDTDPCIHGQCRVEGGQETCDCDAGYTGPVCDQCADGYHPEGLTCVPDEPDPCHPNPCTETNKTVCSLDGESYTCACDPGYHDDGGQCVPDTVDPCDPNPCDQPHRSVCVADGENHVCECDDGYHDEGGQCVPDTGDPCDPNPCEQPNRTVCVADGENYVCECDSGYHDEGGQCVPDTGDPCDPNPCTETHRTVCTADGNNYTCSCDPGYHEQSQACLPDCDVDADLCTAAHPSFDTLVSANGHAALGYSITGRKTDAFLEHVYRNWDEDVWTRDLLYDTYLGIRAPGSNLWLDQITPLRVEYLEQTGIIHVVRTVNDLRIDSYVYAPWEMSRPALVLIGKVTNSGDQPVSVSLYTLHNYHLGDTTVEEPVHPGMNDERIQYQSSSGAYLETGPGGILIHHPLGTTSHHGCTPDNPWEALQAGQDLADTADSGTGDDRVAGFQKDFTLAPGASGWFGVVTAFERFGDDTALAQDVIDAYGSTTADQVLADALDAWEAWRHPAPAGLSPAERMVWRQSEAVLRQGQVWEDTDLSHGQILASMPPGNWNICWMRDMAYATVALTRSGHLAEARAALEFVLQAESGLYEQDYVGVPYQVTITRYFGRGKEETDFNADGPNIEFDGFGLYLWALGIYLEVSGDDSLLDDHWALIRDEIAGALVSLTDANNGLIDPDSSIWEVHWNGNQKQYTYTTLAAARGLCQAAGMAADRGEDSLATEYETAAIALRDALVTHSVDPSNVLASSLEELQNAWGHYDMASVEAFNWLLFEPAGDIGSATLDMFEASLRISSGLGFFRNDDGGWYDSQEWVFVDLRASVGNRMAGRANVADRLLDWITAQALFNHGMIAELHHPDNGDYEGEIPMVGFGAGAYLLALLERLEPQTVAPACGDWESP